MKFNLSGVKPAEEGGGLTPPGTIDVFTIQEVKFGEKNGKEYFEVKFARKSDSFNEFFYLTEKSAERFVYLYDKVMGTSTLPESEQGIISALTGRSIALKVIGSVNPNSGKGYPCLPYSGYARPANEMSELRFFPKEEQAVKEALEAQAKASNATPPPADPNDVQEANQVFGTEDGF